MKDLLPNGLGACPFDGTDFTKPLLFMEDGQYYASLATLLLAIPFLPGLRDIPRWIPVHRLIWRDWNQQAAAGQPETGPRPEPAGQK